jgi:hypothetical protein
MHASLSTRRDGCGHDRRTPRAIRNARSLRRRVAARGLCASWMSDHVVQHQTARRMCGERAMGALGAPTGTRSACTACDAEGVSYDTGEMSAEYADQVHTSNSTFRRRSGSLVGHHVRAKFTSGRAGAVKARSAAERGGGAERRGLDGTEHRSRLERVMAEQHARGQTVAQTCATHRSEMCGERRPHADHISNQNPLQICAAIFVTAARIGRITSRHAHLATTGKPWRERPHPLRCGATPRAPHRGRSAML